MNIFQFFSELVTKKKQKTKKSSGHCAQFIHEPLWFMLHSTHRELSHDSSVFCFLLKHWLASRMQFSWWTWSFIMHYVHTTCTLLVSLSLSLSHSFLYAMPFHCYCSLHPAQNTVHAHMRVTFVIIFHDFGFYRFLYIFFLFFFCVLYFSLYAHSHTTSERWCIRFNYPIWVEASIAFAVRTCWISSKIAIKKKTEKYGSVCAILRDFSSQFFLVFAQHRSSCVLITWNTRSRCMMMMLACIFHVYDKPNGCTVDDASLLKYYYSTGNGKQYDHILRKICSMNKCC